MKKLVITAAVALFACAAQANTIQALSLNTTEIVNVIKVDDNVSVMTLKVKKVVGAEDKATKLKEDLMKINGIKDVKSCTQSGTVTVSYVKSELGCCSKIHTALKESKWKYELVSNEEKPACSKEGKKMCPGHGKHKGA